MSSVVLSICVATSNRAEALASLLDHLQCLTELTFAVEIVVSDDASSDKTASVLESYQQTVPLRFFCQRRSVGASANLVVALRASRGRYALSLAEDDRIDPRVLERLVGYLNGQTDVVMLNVSSPPLDLSGGVGPEATNHLVEPVTFAGDQGLDCFNFLLEGSLLPDRAIYRSDVLSKVLFSPHGLHIGLVMVFRALRYGQVGFHPGSYCLAAVDGSKALVGEVPGAAMEKSELPPFDHYRGALETSLLSALQAVAPLPLPEELRGQLVELTNQFLVTRIRTAVEQCLRVGDFIAAHELQARSFLWRSDVREAEVREWEDSHLTQVALQSILKMFDLLRFLKGLVLCGFANADEIVSGLELCSPNTHLLVRAREESLSASDREDFMYLVEQPDDTRALTEAGVAPGQVLCLSEVTDQLRVLPRVAVQ